MSTGDDKGDDDTVRTDRRALGIQGRVWTFTMDVELPAKWDVEDVSVWAERKVVLIGNGAERTWNIEEKADPTVDDLLMQVRVMVTGHPKAGVITALADQIMNELKGTREG